VKAKKGVRMWPSSKNPILPPEVKTLRRDEPAIRIAATTFLTLLIYCLSGAAQQTLPAEAKIGQPDSTLETIDEKKVQKEVDEELERPEEPQNLQGFFFSSPFTAAAVRETRLPFEKRSLDDTGAAISLPELTVAFVKPRSDFSLSYHPTFDRFSEHSELNAVTHTANLHFAYDLKRRWVLSVKNSFLRTEDPARKLRESIFILPRTSYQENVLSMSVDFLKSTRTKYTLEATNSFSFLSLKNLSHILPADRFDQVGGALTASVVHKVGVNQRLTNSYSFLLFRELHTGVENSMRRAHNASALYEYGWDQRGVHLELSGGVLHGSSTSYNALFRIGYNWRNLNIYTGYSRQFAFIRTLTGGFNGAGTLQSALAPESIAQVVTLGVAATLKQSLIVDLAAIAGKGDAAIPGNEIRSLSGRAQVAYRLGRVFPFVGAEFYGQNFNPMMESRMARSRYFAGMAVSLSSVTEAANAPVGDYAGKWPLSAPGLAPRRPSKLERGDLK